MRTLAITLALGAAFIVGPAAAQDQASKADADLRCAIWAGALLDLVEDSEAEMGVTAAFTYFMGRFEGANDEPIEEAMTPDLIARETADIEALTEFCQPRMVSLGDRLANFGEQLSEGQADLREQPTTSPPKS